MISARNERACERARAAHFAPALALILLHLGRVRAALGHADAGGLRCQRLAPEADPRGVSYRSLSKSTSSLVSRFSTGDWVRGLPALRRPTIRAPEGRAEV
jgi:hypothetical protein